MEEKIAWHRKGYIADKDARVRPRGIRDFLIYAEDKIMTNGDKRQPLHIARDYGKISRNTVYPAIRHLSYQAWPLPLL